MPPAALIALTLAIARQAPLSADAIYKRTLPSVMTLIVDLPEGQGYGTAFLAIKDGIAVTSWHVVRKARRVFAKFSSGEEFVVSGLIDKDELRDVALVRIKVADRPLLTFSNQDPNIGSHAYVVGNPKGLSLSISDGIISQIQTLAGVKQYQFSCPSSPGNNGGPLLDPYGRVLGVVAWQAAEGQNLNFAAPANYVRGLDASLPTTPWSAVKIEIPDEEEEEPKAEPTAAPEPPKTTPATTPPPTDTPSASKPEEVRRAFEDGLWAVTEAFVATLNATEQVLLANDHGDLGPTAEQYKAIDGLTEARSQLEKIVTGSANIDKAQSQLLAEMKDMEDGLRLHIEAIQAKQSARSFDTVTETKANQALAKFRQARERQTRDELGGLVKNKTFFESLPFNLQLALTPDLDGSGMTLSVMAWPRNPNRLAVVNKGGFGYRLGLRTGDEVVSIGDRPIANLLDVKLGVLENRGRKVKVKLKRDLKLTEIQMSVPKEVPEEFRTNT